MKRLLPILSIAAFSIFIFTSCGSKDTSQVNQASVDTAGLAQFQAYQKQQEFAAQYEMYKTEQDKKLIAAVATRPARKSYQKTGSMNTSTSYPAKAKEEVKKKGWSKAAKGAVIGGASGAVLGGVIYKKNRALGAVIGGVVGAAGGFGIGKHLDKKDASK